MKGRADKGTDDRIPVRPVGMNAPQAPRQRVALALVFERAEHDAPVAQHDGVQGRADIEMTDRFHVAAIIVHDKQLQVDVESIVGWPRRYETVAIAGEHDLAAWQRARAHVA